MKRPHLKSNVKVLAIMLPGDERERLCRSAQGEVWSVNFCESVPQALNLLHSGYEFVAILLDKELAGGQWEASVRNLAAPAGVARILLTSESAATGLWERVVAQGGHELLSKPLRAEQVRRAILHAIWYATALKHANPAS